MQGLISHTLHSCSTSCHPSAALSRWLASVLQLREPITLCFSLSTIHNEDVLTVARLASQRSMARPPSVSTARSRRAPHQNKKKVQSSDSTEEEHASSSDGVSDGRANNDSSGSDSEAGPTVRRKQQHVGHANGKGKQQATRIGGSGAGKRRAIVDDSDEDDGGGAANSDEDDEEDSQNRRVAAGKGVNNTRTAKSSSEGSSSKASNNSSAYGNISKTTGGLSAMQPLQPRSQHSQPQQPVQQIVRSPFRTVSLNDASPGGGGAAGAAAANRRRLSNSRVARADDLRRQSLPSNLRKQASLDSDASFMSAASSSQNSPAAAGAARRGSNSNIYGNGNGNITPTKHNSSSIAQAQIRRTSAGYALQGGGVGALNAAAALHRTASSAAGATAVNEMAAPQLPTLTMEAMNTNYEEWMKMATDNVRGVLCTLSA